VLFSRLAASPIMLFSPGWPSTRFALPSWRRHRFKNLLALIGLCPTELWGAVLGSLPVQLLLTWTRLGDGLFCSSVHSRLLWPDPLATRPSQSGAFIEEARADDPGTNGTAQDAQAAC
jgi:hypothetical protein